MWEKNSDQLPLLLALRSIWGPDLKPTRTDWRSFILQVTFHFAEQHPAN